MSNDLDFRIFGEDLDGGKAQEEAQEAIKAMHRYQRKISGLEITRGGQRATGPTTTAEKQDAVKEDAVKEDPKAAKGDPKAAKGDPKAAKGDPKAAKGDPKAAKVFKQEDTRKALVKVLEQFDVKKEVDLCLSIKGKLLGKYNAKKLTDLDISDYSAFIVDCENYNRDDDDGNEFNEGDSDDNDSLLDD